jgi:hypothetical protein
VDIHEDEQSADLISCLSKLLMNDSISAPEVIFEPSAVIAFHLVRHEPLPSYAGSASAQRRMFRFPKHFYLDQFMKENFELANAKRIERQTILEKIQQLNLRKTTLTNFKVKPNHLRSPSVTDNCWSRERIR